MNQINLVEKNNIPSELKEKNQWVTWQAGDIDANGKFAKYPIHPSKNYKVAAHNPSNQISFIEAIRATSNQHVSGIGFVLNGETFSANKDGEILYLIGIDIDHKAGLSTGELKAIWDGLDKPYVEVSPSKSGIRMFCLSKRLLANRNQNGLEIYSSGRFLTITGWSGKGTIKDCTEKVLALHAKWFPPIVRVVRSGHVSTKHYPPPENPRNIARLLQMLSFIDPDCSYETYRNVIWAIEYTGWSVCEELERNWSLGAPERFTEDGLTIIRSSFDFRGRGITLGTLVHYAKVAGYEPNSNALCSRQGELV